MPSYIKGIRQNYLGAMPSAKVPTTGLERGDEVYVTDIVRAAGGTGNMCFRDTTSWLAVDTGLPVTLGTPGAGGGVFPPEAPNIAIPASILLEGFESATGFSTGPGYLLALDAVNKKEGTNSLVMSHTVGQTGDAISTKTLANPINAQDLGIVTATVWHDQIPSENTTTVTVTKDSIAMSAGALALNNDNDIPLWRTIMLDTADVASKPAGTGTATLQIRNSARAPSGARMTFDSVYAHDEDMPTIIIRCDDATKVMQTEGAAYAKSKGFPLNFFLPDQSVNAAPAGNGFTDWDTVLAAEAAGHGIGINFSRDDSGPTAAVTRSNFVANAIACKDALLAKGVSNRMLGLGVASNGALDLNANYPINRLSDVIYDGSGGASFTTAPANPPAVGMIFEGWDITANKFVRTTIQTAPSATTFTTAYPFPANSSGSAVSKRGYYRLNGEFLDRKLGDDLKTAGFKLGLRTINPSDVKVGTKRGLVDFFVPCQGFTSETTIAPFQTSMQQSQKYGCTIIWYLHTWVVDGTAPGIGHNAALLKSVFDMLGTEVAAGRLWVPRMDKWMARMGLSAAFG